MTERRWYAGGVEPQIEELLADPIMDLILRYDRITLEDVWDAIRGLRRDQEEVCAA